MDSVLQDIRYALRTFRRNPAFTIIAILALAIGIGATTAIFSVVDAAILKPLPYKDPEQLVQLWMRFTGIGIPNDQNWVSAPEYTDLQQNGVFSHTAAVETFNYNIHTGGAPERVEAARVSISFFPLLGVQAQVGRVFLEEEGKPGRENAVLLSDGFWRRHYGADPTVPGRKLIMNGSPFVIAGVLPAGFQYPRDAELWTPLVFTADDLSPNNRGSHSYRVIARSKPGLTLQRVRSEMTAVATRIMEQNPAYPYRDYNFGVIVIPLLEQQIGDIKLALMVLMGAVGLVLLIGCANVANLLLVRASARQREISVRQALGISKWRLTRQLLTESIVLALMGGIAGCAISYWTLRVLIVSAAQSFPRIAETRMDLPVLLFAVAVSLATGILFGMAPVWQSARGASFEPLREGARGTAGRTSHRLRGALVVGELALSLALLAGSGLLIRSFLRLQEVDTGFRSGGVLTMGLSLPSEKYKTAAQTSLFYRELLDRVRTIPGVDAAGATTGLPLSGDGWSGTTTIDTNAVPERERTPETDQRPVTPGYFEALGIPLLQGRYFDAHDTDTAARVAIVDETLAKTYWPGEDAVGKRIKSGDRASTDPWRTIVGVVKHVRYRTLESPSRVEFYWPYAQTPYPVGGMALAIHTPAEPQSLALAVQKAVFSLDPDQPVYRVRAMQELVSESMARRRLSTFLLSIFAGLAVVLAAVGIYGVMSYSVAQRFHEMGIRMALGARSADVLWLVLRRSLSLTLGGLFAGLAGSLVLTRFLGKLLFEVQATDPVTYASVAVFLGLVALVASFIPAYRATTVNPVTALREE